MQQSTCAIVMFTQALWRNIQRFGLSEDYKASNETGHWLHLFNGLPFLPSNEVPDAFSFDIIPIAPNSSEAGRFADYFCDTYIDTNCFPPSIWSRIPSAAHRTTNGAESFNRHFSNQFNSPHSSFYVFWDILVKQQAVTYTIANSLKQHSTYCYSRQGKN